MGLMSDLAAEKQLSGTVRLYDIDSEAARRNEKIGQLLQKNADVEEPLGLQSSRFIAGSFERF